jgi:phospholipase C
VANTADLEKEQEYMKSYREGDRTVAATQTLAKHFVVCDRWFASMPGPTVPNRLFVHTASSGGYAGKSSQ